MLRRSFFFYPGALLAACGGGGSDAPPPAGRYMLDFSGARLENAEGSVFLPRPTILRAELVLDGEVIGTYSSSSGSQEAAFIVGTQRRNAGQSRLDFRIAAQTVVSAPYLVTPSGFVGISDTQTGGFTLRNLNRGSISSPYTQTLRAGEAITITFAIP